MDRPIDPITEADLEAYVEDQLPVARRIEVEAHLCRHPDEAVRVITDLKIRDELRLALAGPPYVGRSETAEAALRLERGLSRDRFLRQLRKVAAVAVLVAAGWLAHAEFGALRVGEVVASAIPPAYVVDAMQAHRTAEVRAGMASQPAAPRYDPAEIRSATAIGLPPLPEGWSVADVQIFPSTFGPSVEMAIRTEALGTVSLFAVRPGAFDVVPASVAHHGDLAAAYWQMGEVAYALVARADSKDLDRAAGRLVRALY
ncbi:MULTISPECIES: anti-sigma factor [Chelatococcus]|uniref:Anti-sigma factor RsiW n=1 Tax=Chelatococcus caeni TaxID=1348468 RepID=A0A840C0F0_9HYPH|nr:MULTISPECIES: anti-sigma factor [Chelatococcus]ALA19959.1 Fis family transcriptional regulator [Chelatococcus sp. CO-6]MBB4018690.1 anti-sigma factor RsiW [Chelatococcus caeni]